MTTDPLAPPTPLHRRKAVWVALAAVAAGVVVAVFAKPLFLWPMWSNGASQREFTERLLAEQDPKVLEVVASTFRDASKGADVRVANGHVLVRRNRLSVVEDALKDARLDLRVVALRVLSREAHFREQYVERPGWRVAETVAEWFSDRGARSRAGAFDVLSVVCPTRESVPPEVLRALREMVRPGPDGDPDPRARGSAAQRLAGWGDCESVPGVLALAKQETEGLAQMALMQAVVLFWDTGGGACRAVLPEAEVRAVVERALDRQGDDNVNRGVRMAAMSALSTHEEWARPHAERLRRTLESMAANDAERRSALEAAVAAGDESVVSGLARWFHDRAPGVRSSAVSLALGSVQGIDPRQYESCLVGLVRDERDASGKMAFLKALGGLRVRAGVWVGFRKDKASTLTAEQAANAQSEFFKSGAWGDVTRDSMAAAWFEWLCERNGVKGSDAEEAAKARGAFWAKAAAGDVAGARAIHDAGAVKAPNLWTYERGWLLAKGAS